VVKNKGGVMEINKLLVDGGGWKYSSDGPIERFLENGEMASITWYRHKRIDGTIIAEYNGKYVIEILYKDSQ